MDLATIIGVLVAFGLVLMGIVAGGPLTLFVNIPSLLITIGGTFGIIFIILVFFSYECPNQHTKC